MLSGFVHPRLPERRVVAPAAYSAVVGPSAWADQAATHESVGQGEVNDVGIGTRALVAVQLQAAAGRNYSLQIGRLRRPARSTASEDGSMTGAVWHVQFSEDLDFRDRTEPTSRYVICSTPRCGSHFLGHLMYSWGAFGYPLEYVNPSNLPIWEQRAATSNAASVIEYIMSRRTSPNGCFGIKAHYKHLSRLLKTVGPRSLVDEYKFIFLRRRDLLSQAVSLALSRQTGSWISGTSESKRARYDTSLIDKCLQEIASDNASWEMFLSRLALPTVHVLYEEIRANPERELHNIAKFLGVACVERAGQNEQFMPKPERSGKKREWALTFSQEARARFITPGHVAKKRFFRRLFNTLRHVAK